jgi:hypothetical protein
MEYEIKFTQQEIQTILQGLGELPSKYSFNLLVKIQQQIHIQDQKNAISLDDLHVSDNGSE